MPKSPCLMVTYSAGVPHPKKTELTIGSARASPSVVLGYLKARADPMEQVYIKCSCWLNKFKTTLLPGWWFQPPLKNISQWEG